ncbi:hypothetical protein SBA4_190040 [Candidatus Sulfopaludibacter sp. SbA4]|nr:hypothetical protein SBA4_190040 [Candidatus Sulfopaludibacter sp. SbA4]
MLDNRRGGRAYLYFLFAGPVVLHLLSGTAPGFRSRLSDYLRPRTEGANNLEKTYDQSARRHRSVWALPA